MTKLISGVYTNDTKAPESHELISSYDEFKMHCFGTMARILKYILCAILIVASLTIINNAQANGLKMPFDINALNKNNYNIPMSYVFCLESTKNGKVKWVVYSR